MTKRALVTGISGQDGAFLAQHLLGQGYEVHGAVRRTSTANLSRLDELGIRGEVQLIDFDLFEPFNVRRVLEKVRPNEIYNLAAQSFVGVSFEQPIYTSEVDGLGVARILESIREVDRSIRFYQASTSEMFGKVQTVPQSETTPFYPRSPYAVAKLYAHWMTVNYRESYGIFGASGILFNHESHLRGQEFVTRKITLSLARVKHGQQDHVALGNLDAQRDWGYAGDYVVGMHAMLQASEPDDYVLATGKTATVRAFIEQAAERLGMALEWRGTGEATEGVDARSGRTVVRVDPRFYRPAEVDLLLGDYAKAKTKLNWEPATDLAGLVGLMVEADERRVVDGQVRF